MKLMELSWNLGNMHISQHNALVLSTEYENYYLQCRQQRYQIRYKV